MGSRRIVVGGIALVALLAVVGLASRAHTPTGSGSTQGLDRALVAEYAMLFMLALAQVSKIMRAVVPREIIAALLRDGHPVLALTFRRRVILGRPAFRWEIFLGRFIRGGDFIDSFLVVVIGWRRRFHRKRVGRHERI